MIKLDPSHFATAAIPDYDPVFGDQEKPQPNPERALTDDAYLVFASGPGARVLQDLITRYLAAPVFDSGRDAAKGYERNGEANVVRDLMKRMNDSIERQQRRS